MVPLEGLVDPSAELAKLQKDQREAARRTSRYLKRKLARPELPRRAPPEVVDKDKAKLAELKAALAKLLIAIDRLK